MSRCLPELKKVLLPAACCTTWRCRPAKPAARTGEVRPASAAAWGQRAKGLLADTLEQDDWEEEEQEEQDEQDEQDEQEQEQEQWEEGEEVVGKEEQEEQQQDEDREVMPK